MFSTSMATRIQSGRADSMISDSAFEPRSDFVFDGGDEEFSNMQRNLDTINSLNDSNCRQGIHSVNGIE